MKNKDKKRTPIEKWRRKYLSIFTERGRRTNFADQCSTWNFIIDVWSVFDSMFEKRCSGLIEEKNRNEKRNEIRLTTTLTSFAANEAPSHWSVLLSNDVPTRTFASPKRKKKSIWKSIRFVLFYHRDETEDVDIVRCCQNYISKRHLVLQLYRERNDHEVHQLIN